MARNARYPQPKINEMISKYRQIELSIWSKKWSKNNIKNKMKANNWVSVDFGKEIKRLKIILPIDSLIRSRKKNFPSSWIESKSNGNKIPTASSRKNNEIPLISILTHAYIDPRRFNPEYAIEHGIWRKLLDYLDFQKASTYHRGYASSFFKPI